MLALKEIEVDKVLTQTEVQTLKDFNSFDVSNLDYYEADEFKCELAAQLGIGNIMKKVNVAVLDGLLDKLKAMDWEVLKRWEGSDGWGGKTEWVILFRAKDEEIIKGYYKDRAIFKDLNYGAVRWFDKNTKEEDL